MGSRIFWIMLLLLLVTACESAPPAVTVPDGWAQYRSDTQPPFSFWYPPEWLHGNETDAYIFFSETKEYGDIAFALLNADWARECHLITNQKERLTCMTRAFVMDLERYGVAIQGITLTRSASRDGPLGPIHDLQLHYTHPLHPSEDITVLTRTLDGEPGFQMIYVTDHEISDEKFQLLRTVFDTLRFSEP